MAAAGRRAGFSLIELLVVCAILAVVITAIGACLAGGIRVWDAARRFHVGESDAILALEHMRRDLGGTFIFGEIPFEAGREHLSFPGIVRESASEAGKLATIVYKFNRGTLGTLTRETTEYPDGRVHSELLLSDALDIQFNVIAPESQLRLANTGLPARVEIDIVIQEQGQDQSMKLSRSISLPAGGR
jgi:prepilin-type N-terminal cleavage/methylation domain-containing protein